MINFFEIYIIFALCLTFISCNYLINQIGSVFEMLDTKMSIYEFCAIFFFIGIFLPIGFVMILIISLILFIIKIIIGIFNFLKNMVM